MKNQLKVYKRIGVAVPVEKTLTVNNLRAFWKKAKNSIESRIKEFKNVFTNGREEDIFAELVFCLFTPQSKAVSCAEAVRKLDAKGLISSGSACKIAKEINIVRFRNNKAGYVVEARKKFTENGRLKIKAKLRSFDDVLQLRTWLVENIKGMGFKEASHFLRNIGLGDEVAILDRHILRNLKKMGVIKNIPETINDKSYFKIENRMKSFAKKNKIPLEHLDLLFWCKETGEIFK